MKSLPSDVHCQLVNRLLALLTMTCLGLIGVCHALYFDVLGLQLPQVTLVSTCL